MERGVCSPSSFKRFYQIRLKPDRVWCNLSKKNKNGRSLDEKQKGSDNKVMITYINNMGDTKSKKFINLANTCNSNKGVPTRGYEKRARLEKSS